MNEPKARHHDGQGYYVVYVKKYVPCGQDVGMQRCNLPLGHACPHDRVRTCLLCCSSPCICNTHERGSFELGEEGFPR
jgi:hypothetical protein